MQYFIIILLLFIFGCTPRSNIKMHEKPYAVDGKYYFPVRESSGFVEQGLASWYGKDFHGKKTSNGEIYDMNLKTAAHKTLPLGTYVKVTNLENDKEIVVRVNDRGPFVRGRIIDLSYKAGCEIGIDVKGIVKVRVEALDRDDIRAVSVKDFSKGNFTIQVGAFKNKENADRLEVELKKVYTSTHSIIFNADDAMFYRVRVGKFSDLGKANESEKELEARGYKEAMVVAE